MKKIILAVVVLAAIVAASNVNVNFNVIAHEEAESKKASPKVIGMLFYADWCQSCKMLEPKLNQIKKDYKGKGILFTRFNLTDDFTKEQSELYASWIGFEEIYKENPKTGFMLLVDPKEKKVLGKLIKTQSVEELKKGLEDSLAKSSEKSEK